MKNSPASQLKSAIIGSALALASQTALANKPLPCPTTSPLVDTLGLVQGTTKQKMENSLRNIDSEKHHQVVVVTVNSLDEYGYASTEEMARKFLNTCQVGYRGENTGVVVLYAKNAPAKKYWVTPSSGVSGYIPDATVQQLGRHSLEACNKDNVACRLDDITDGISKIIRKQFPDKQAVQTLKNADVKFDEQKASKETSEYLNLFGMGAVIIVVLGGGVAGGNALVKRNRRKALKKQIFELGIRLKTEISKYPDWFLGRYIYKAEKTMSRLETYSDNQLDALEKYENEKTVFDRDISFVTSCIDGMKEEFEEILARVATKRKEVENQIQTVANIQKRLIEEGFKFSAIDIPTLPKGSNPDETISLLNQTSLYADEALDTLGGVRQTYQSADGLGAHVEKEFAVKKYEYIRTVREYTDIYGTAKAVNLTSIENQVMQFVQNFQSAYQEKDINKLLTFSRQAKTLLSPIGSAVDSMKQGIGWYNELPSKISKRQDQLAGVQMKPSYADDAQRYMRKTKDSTFVDYNMGAMIIVLGQLLTSISQNHSKKQHLEEIEKEFQSFDATFATLKRYMGLGAALTAIVAEEIAHVEQFERRRREEKRQREDEECRRQEAEEQRQRDAVAAALAAAAATEEANKSSNSTPAWTPGGGGGGDGGGGGFD